MQVSPSVSSISSLNSYSDVCDEFRAQLNINKAGKSHQFDDGDQRQSQLDYSDDEREEEEEDFSFVCNGGDGSPVSAADVFQDGQIRPIFPLFNRDLLLADYEFESSDNRWPRSPAVKKVFVEAPPPPSSSSSSSESEEIDEVAEGPYCAWSKKATEASPEVCNKSNSTGFSKLWRFRDYVNRSNSDGRDAFVFLNNSTTSSAKREEKVVEKSDTSSEKKTVIGTLSEKKTAGEVKVNPNGGKVKVKKGVKGQTASLSAHEVYMRNKGLQGEDRRRSYLPYRPVVGFFTNVNGGLSRNVHPF